MDFRSRLRRTALPFALLGAAAVPASAHGAASALGIPCAAQPDGVQFCQGSTSAGGHPVVMPDGVPLDVNVTLPSGSGPFPLVIIGHGYGGSKKGLDSAESPWYPTAHVLAGRGYAVVNATDRGFGESCGSPQSRMANPGVLPGTPSCAKGWIHLMDARFEVHDAQYMAGQLADENLVQPTKIGAIGESYGGGESLMLGTLKNRVMDLSGKLQPWTSPKGTPMSIAAAAPTIPWSDLISSLVPNGNGLDYTLPKPADNYTPVGVLKQSFVAGLFASGAASGYYAPPGTDPQADLNRWFATLNAGEPYDGNPMIPPIIDAIRLYRSSLHVLDGTAGQSGADSVAPAPMLISNGFTDDLFPVDEALRYYNLEKSLFPGAPVALTHMDYGHMRGQNKKPDIDLLKGQIDAWLDHYVKGGAPDPGQAVTALTQTCPSTAPSGGPFTASSWSALHPGTVQYTSNAAQTLTSAAGDPTISAAIDPIAGKGACASVSAADQQGVATYRLPAATGNGYTMIGSPTVQAQINVTGVFPEIAERLWDVAPDGTQTLVARGDFRPPADTSAVQLFQLHPGAWRFVAGHVPKLELLGNDKPYLRQSNGQFQIAISALRLLLPTVESSGNGITVPPGLPAPPGSTAAPGAATTPVTPLPPPSAGSTGPGSPAPPGAGSTGPGVPVPPGAGSTGPAAPGPTGAGPTGLTSTPAAGKITKKTKKHRRARCTTARTKHQKHQHAVNTASKKSSKHKANTCRKKHKHKKHRMR